MGIQFKEIKNYIGKKQRLSIYIKEDRYFNYLKLSDVPNDFDSYYVYGIGMIDTEFADSKNFEYEAALEIVIQKEPRDIKRKNYECLLFKDLKPYLQIGQYFSIVNKENASHEEFEWRKQIPETYDEMHVCEICMEKNPAMQQGEYTSYRTNQMVIVLGVLCEEV